MRRRDFIAAIYAAALVSPTAAAAPQAGKIWRIGNVLPITPEQGAIFAQALEQRLADLGDVPGRNITLFHRFTGPHTEKIESTIISLVPQIDLLVTWGNAATAAKKLAGGLPTIFVSFGFPVEAGLVQSLAHPGGNMTGITAEAALETDGKRLQILKQIAPHLERVAVLRGVDDVQFIEFEKTWLDSAAREIGVGLVFVDFKSADDLAGAFASIKKNGADAVFVTRTALSFTLGKEIADLALAARLPSCYSFSEAVTAGGLVSLGPDRVAMTGPAAAQIDKIIKGVSPADIPVEQPTRYQLYINLKTARLLNLTIPPTLLALADQLIE